MKNAKNSKSQQLLPKNLLFSVAAFFVKTVYLLHYATIRLQVINLRNFPPQKGGHDNFIYVLWHAKSFALLLLLRDIGVGTVVLKDWKNRVFGEYCRQLGYKPFLFSTPQRAALQFKKMLENGEHVTIVADGPIGQIEPFKPGVFRPGAAYLSYKTSRPIIAMRVETTKSFRFKKRWDNYEIPFPFSKVVVTFSEPIYIKDLEYSSTETLLKGFLGSF